MLIVSVVVAYLFKVSISEPYSLVFIDKKCCDEKLHPPIDLFSKSCVNNHMCAK